MTIFTSFLIYELSIYSAFDAFFSNMYCTFSLPDWHWLSTLLCVLVTQSCPTLCDPMDCVVHGLLQARILEWVSFPFSRGSSQPRDRTRVSCIAGGFFTSWATRKAHQSPPLSSNTILQPQLETCFLCSNIWTAKTGDKGHKINWEWAPRMISAVPDCFSSYPHNNCPKQPRTLPSGLPSLHPF